jgi:hypothetical protein
MKKLYSNQQPLRRSVHPVIKVLDEKAGIVNTSPAMNHWTLTTRSSGPKAMLQPLPENAPFVDSHNYGCIDCLLGQVIDWRVQNRQVIETVKWAIDAGLPEDHLANIGFKLTVAGYLKAVSIGFATSYVTKWDANPTAFQAALKDMNVAPGTDVRAVFLGMEQMELSACVIGANPNAVAKAYKAGILNDAALENFPQNTRNVKPPTSPTIQLMRCRPGSWHANGSCWKCNSPSKNSDRRWRSPN